MLVEEPSPSCAYVLRSDIIVGMDWRYMHDGSRRAFSLEWARPLLLGRTSVHIFGTGTLPAKVVKLFRTKQRCACSDWSVHAVRQASYGTVDVASVPRETGVNTRKVRPLSGHISKCLSPRQKPYVHVSILDIMQGGHGNVTHRVCWSDNLIVWSSSRTFHGIVEQAGLALLGAALAVCALCGVVVMSRSGPSELMEVRMPNGRIVDLVPVQALRQRQHRMTQLFGPGDLPIPIEDDGLPGGACT